MLSTAESLVSRMHNLSERLDEIRSGVEGQIKETVSQISTYAKNIAEVNNKITIAQQAGSSQPANDLLDTRDQLVKELNQLVRVSTSTDADGSMSVFIGTGQPLVVGSESVLDDGLKCVLLVEDHAGYTRLCELITVARRNADGRQPGFADTEIAGPLRIPGRGAQPRT